MDSSAGPNHDGNAKPPEAEPTAEADTSNPPAPPSPTMEQQDSIADPPYSADKPPSPVQHIDSSSPAKDDDVIVTGTAYNAPGNPVALSKHTAKDESTAMNKGKGTTDLSAYTGFSAQDLHSGFLNRLYTSRDFEAGLVNLMKERYEVNIALLKTLPLYCIVAPKGRFVLRKSNRYFVYFML